MRTEHSCPQFAGVNASDDDMNDIKRKGEKAASENIFSVYCGDNLTSLPQNVIDGMMNVKKPLADLWQWCSQTNISMFMSAARTTILQ